MNKLFVIGINTILITVILMGKEKVIDPFTVNNILIPSTADNTAENNVSRYMF